MLSQAGRAHRTDLREYFNKKGVVTMNRVRQMTRCRNEAAADAGSLGKQVCAAVLDTGIIRHPDFENRILAFQDCLHGKTEMYDDNSHGTHVSAIIGGNGSASEGKFAGMAPGCSLIAVKVLDEKGNGNISYVLRGIEWVLNHREAYRIRIVNISVGTLPGVNETGAKELVRAVETLWDAGIVVVTAAGNYGPLPGTITSPGISRKVITVGSCDDQIYTENGQRRRKSYSGRGPTAEFVVKPDVLAPGSYITACNAKYGLPGQKPYAVKSGTSMSTPVVSGAAALLLSKYPGMTNVEVKLRLRESSTDLGLPNNQQGWGLLNVERLLRD